MIRSLLLVLACTAGASSALAGPPALPAEEARFAEALKLHREGRFAAAYGRFVALADRGHADGARWALVMLRYGPQAYRTQYGASEEQVAYWTWVTLHGPKFIVLHNGE